jgi:tol-pal system protein YbgF
MISRFGSIAAAWFLIASMAIGVAVLSTVTVQAQSNNDVANRITRLEAEIRDLQRHLFAGKSNAAPVRSSTAVTETALTPKDGGSTPTSATAARSEIRLQQLEAQMRNLTGKIEELDFKITRSIGRIDTLVSDLDRRFAALEGTKVSNETTVNPTLENGSSDTNSSVTGAASGGGLFTAPGAKDAKKAGVLGYLNESDLRQVESKRRAAQSAEPRQASAIPPSEVKASKADGSGTAGPILPQGDPGTRYKHAFSFLMRHDYDTAEKAFREFVDGHGDDPLAGNAMYWLGETYYVREMFAQSAVTFAEGYEKYPGSPKTADNLLKLGFSLARLKRSEDACVALAQLSDEFPNASATIKRRAMNEGKRIGCKG